jgi:CheY-like chemotaxis protein
MNSTVLAVDDNKVVLGSTVRMLGSLGYATIPAETGGEALRMIASRPDLTKGQCDG